MKSKNHYYILIIIFALVFYATFIYGTAFRIDGKTYFSLFDDAMISMRYAKNLAEGNGLVWNQGEYVEGYTNFLWTLWMACIHLLPIGKSKTSLLIEISGILILLLNLWVIKLIAERMSKNSFLFVFFAMFLNAFYYGLIYWTLRGMEVGLLSLLINYSVLLSFSLFENYNIRDFIKLIITLCLLLLVRTDSIVPSLIILLFIGSTVKHEYRIKTVVAISLGLFLTIGAHTIFRYFYYGDLLPNTYYLKLTGVSLIERISRGWQVFNNLVQKRLYTLLIPIILYISLSINKKINKRFFLLVILFCGISSYSIYVGGDAWEWMPYPNRYITIGMPLLILAACFSVYKINSHPNRLIILMALILLIIICYWLSALKIFYFFVPFIFVLALLYNFYEKKQKKLPMLSIKASPVLPFLIFILIGYLVNNVAYRHWVSYNAIHVYDDMNMTFLGCSISLNTTSDTKIAVNWAGAVPYFSNRYSIDLSGKMDKWIAKSKPATKKFWPGHNKWNYTYSIETYHPDIFVEYEPKHLPEYGYKYLENRGYEMFANDFYINKNSIAKFNKNFLANPFHYKWISLQQ